MKILWARIRAGLFQMRHIFKGYRVSECEIDGRVYWIEVIDGDGRSVMVFYSRISDR